MKSIITNKKIMLAVGVILFTGAAVTYGTGAFFSDTAKAESNVFTAGTLALKIAKDSAGTPTGGWLDTQTAPWNFTAMAPGATPDVSSVWLKNTGTVDGMKLSIAAANTETVGGYEKQVRITELTFDGKNLLEGGAGATIPEYVAPTNCDVTVSGTKISAETGNTTNSGKVVCVASGDYNATWEGVTVIPVTVPMTIVSVDGPDTTTSIGFNVTADNVTIKGFAIETSQYVGIQVTDADGATIEHNVFKDFGSATGAVNTQAVYLVDGSSDAVVQYNMFDGVRADSVSAKAIYVGHTAGTPNASNIEISNNIIKNVETNKGAYGVLVNAAGITSGLVIKNNTFDGLTGAWTHAVGLEGDTSNAMVTLNTFAGLVGTTYDAAAVFFEANPSASSVTINDNNFEKDIPGVALHPVNQAGTYTIDAKNNWWGDFDPSDQVFEVNSTIDTSDFAGGPIAGFIGGIDQNGNGYADMQDLRITKILNATPALNAGEQKKLVMAVQLDGPTTGNNFQGANLTTNLTFTLNQI